MNFRVVIRQKSMDAVCAAGKDPSDSIFTTGDDSPLIETGISFLVPGKKMLDTPAK